jgi:hypothetical protein
MIYRPRYNQVGAMTDSKACRRLRPLRPQLPALSSTEARGISPAGKRSPISTSAASPGEEETYEHNHNHRRPGK